MKIGFWLDANMSKELGGGYSYNRTLISAFDNYAFNNEIELVFISEIALDSTMLSKEVITLPNIKLNIKLTEKIKYKLAKYFSKRIQNKIIGERRRNTEKIKQNTWKSFIVEKQVKAIFYPFQQSIALDNFPFIATNWDLAHFTIPPFPELIEDGQYEHRENWYKHIINKALLIIAESNTGKDELCKYVNISPDKIRIVPLFASNIVNTLVNDNTIRTILNKYELEPNNFYLYPAQFWAHKNHYHLIHAFKQVHEKNPRFKLVLTGSDKGNLSYIKSLVQKLNLQENILFAGFVSNEELYSLYKHALALVMPTFLGPTNMPLLEAIHLGCPVLCSDIEGHKKQLLKNAIFFNPYDINEMANCMQQIAQTDFRMKYLDSINKETILVSMNTIMERFNSAFVHAASIRNCWQ